jgi:hypothetical protein
MMNGEWRKGGTALSPLPWRERARERGDIEGQSEKKW